MSQKINVSDAVAAVANIDHKKYHDLYQQSINHPDDFWREQGKHLQWIKPYTRVKNASFEGDVLIRWFEDGTLNASSNCTDRHLPKRANQTAILWEGDDPNEQRRITYRELHDEVCRWANVLKAHGIKKGDCVTLYLPMIPEAAFAMLACARLGAIHSVVFGGFSPESLKDRILDCRSTMVITSDEGLRGGKRVPLKSNVDAALKFCPHVKSVLVVRRTGGSVAWVEGRDSWVHEETERASSICEAVELSAEDPLFILYTSGSTGKPKGVLHTTAGYLLYASLTHKYVLDYHDGDIYWCSADIGWVTGHSYIIYGPLVNGATTLMFEGIPNYPDYSRFWRIVDKYRVNIFYTAPTAIRALMREGEDYVRRTSRKSLRILATVGEPISPDVWLWYYTEVGDKRCPVIDTWWQTETGGHMIAPMPGAMTLKPGSATLPFFGIKPIIVDGEGQVLEGECEGNLCIESSWPGQMRTVYGDHERFIQTYFSTFKGKYFTGDGCRRDADGYYWITGRVDDVINVSGHRLGTAEIEGALISNHKVAEAAVVGYPHDLKGQGIYAYVSLKTGEKPNDDLRAELIKWVRHHIGPIATPDIIQWSVRLPKTRSGKIMRRLLRKIAANEIDSLGDTSTLADPSVLDELIKGRKELHLKI